MGAIRHDKSIIYHPIGALQYTLQQSKPSLQRTMQIRKRGVNTDSLTPITMSIIDKYNTIQPLLLPPLYLFLPREAHLLLQFKIPIFTNENSSLITPTMKINPKAIQFLKRLEKNNHREWFNEHKATYKSFEMETKVFYQDLKEKLEITDNIEQLKMFRIYRDVRFSKDKTPYNTHFSGYFSRATERLRGSYYVKIKPNASMIGCGFWGPNKEDLFRIRKEFENDDAEIREILNDKTFRNTWGNFVGQELKTAPRGFDKEHKSIDLIKRKQYIFTKEFTDKEMLANDFSERIIDAFVKVRPFLNYMSEILTTDLNGVSILDHE